MIEIGKLFGWLTVYLFAFAVASFFLKIIFKTVINKPSMKKYTNFTKYYKLLMKFIVKNHKIIGIAPFVTLLVHFIIMYMDFYLSISGVIAGLMIVAMVALGIIQVYVVKKPRGAWVKYHRAIGLALIVAIIIHLVIKR